MKTIHKLARPQLPETPKLKVAAYARVSTGNEEQLSSLKTQITHYENYIKRNPEWEYVDVYYDEGISGTKTAKRDGLNQMISDAELGKIDLILTKSISRFSRNTVDCLNLVRKLKDINVTIIFEKENINSGDMEGELMLSILSSLAESESYSISENMKWGIRKRMSKGVYKISKPSFGYTREGTELFLHPVNAKAVRKMFDMALEGVPFDRIARELNEAHFKPPRAERWRGQSIKSILQNEAYTGVMTLQRTFTDDQYRRHKNNGELPMYRIENNHPAIVTQDEFDRVQQLIQVRAASKGNVTDRQKYQNRYAFSAHIYCDKCGGKYRRKRVYWKRNKKRVEWQCGNHCKNKDACENMPIKDDDLKIAYLTMMNKLIFAHSQILSPLMTYYKTAGVDEELMAHLDEQEEVLQEKLEMLSTLATSALIAARLRNEEYTKLQAELNSVQERRQALTASIDGTGTQLEELEKLYRFVSNAKMITKWDEALFSDYAEKVIVYNREHVAFVLKCGLTLEERIPE